MKSRETHCARSRRGQAALEYLITYGWGFAVLIIMIGALAYMGFLNPTRYIPARCEFGAQLECVDYRLSAASGAANGQVQLRFRNNFGDAISITRIETVNGNGVNLASPANIASGNNSEIITFNIPIADALYLAQDDRSAVQLIITFRRNNPAIPGSPLHNVTGEIFATVQ